MKPLYTQKEEPMAIACFTSGEGTNLRRLIEKQLQPDSVFKVVMIFTDTKDDTKCNAKKIAEEYGIPYYCNDIKEYYSTRGYRDRKDMNVRKSYDKETVELLKKHKVDVVALCGYLSIVSGEICDNYLTLNVHPADLRILDSKCSTLVCTNSFVPISFR